MKKKSQKKSPPKKGGFEKIVSPGCDGGCISTYQEHTGKVIVN
jgi:hypothetical protein